MALMDLEEARARGLDVDLTGLESAIEGICSVVDSLRARNRQLAIVAGELAAACRTFTNAAHDTRDEFNDRGLAAPASLAYAAECARHAIEIAEANGVT